MRSCVVAVCAASILLAPLSTRTSCAEEPRPGTPAVDDAAQRAKWSGHLGGAPVVLGHEAGMKTALAAGRPPLLLFAATWCPGCRVLADSVLRDESIKKILSGYTLVLIDGDVEPALLGRYVVRGYPTLMLVDSAGAEIDRIEGPLPPPEYQRELERIGRGEGTLPALSRRCADAPEDIDAGLAFGTRLATSQPEAALALFAKLVGMAKTKDRGTQARVALARAGALLASGQPAEAAAEAERVVRDFADTPSAGAAATRVGRAFVDLEATRALAFLDAVRAAASAPRDTASVEKLTIEVHDEAIARALKRQAEASLDDPEALREVARACLERRRWIHQGEAVGWARIAVEKSGRDPVALDTLAQLLWLTGAREDALRTELEAAKRAPERERGAFEACAARWQAELAAGEAARQGPGSPPGR